MIGIAEFIGLAAATLTTGAYLPQVVKILRERDTRAISLWMYVMMTSGIVLWALYGVLIGSWPVMIGNGVVLVLAGLVLVMKLKCG